MLAAWLGDLTVKDFRARHLGREPLARPGTAASALPLFTFDVLGEVLAAELRPDVLVVAQGRLLERPPPRTVPEVHALFAEGVGLGLRDTQRCHAGLARLAEDFERLLGKTQVQLYVTPPGAHGFTWHYDDEDVFIAQTLGTKDYYFRANTVAAHLEADGSAFRRYPAERSPVCAATLIPGDFLYLPARWWHRAISQTDGPCLSISVGVRPRGKTLAP